MAVCIDLPTELEAILRDQFADLDAVAKETFLVELYRREKITHHDLASALDLERFEANEVLKRHEVTEDLPSVSELRQQAIELESRLAR